LDYQVISNFVNIFFFNVTHEKSNYHFFYIYNWSYKVTIHLFTSFSWPNHLHLRVRQKQKGPLWIRPPHLRFLCCLIPHLGFLRRHKARPLQEGPPWTQPVAFDNDVEVILLPLHDSWQGIFNFSPSNFSMTIVHWLMFQLFFLLFVVFVYFAY